MYSLRPPTTRRRVRGPGLQGGGHSFCRPSRDCGITGRCERARASMACRGRAMPPAFSWERTEQTERDANGHGFFARIYRINKIEF
jgi:hypothetical protein